MAKAAPKKSTQETPPPRQADPETGAAETIERAGFDPTELLVPSSQAPDFAADEAELGSEPSLYRWHLSRAVFRGAKREWETCTSYPAGAGVLTADVIREDWGPGTYYAQLRPSAGSGIGHGGVAKTRTFTLAAPRVPAVGPGTTSTTETLLQKLIENQQRGFEQLGQTLAGRAPAAAVDPAAMLDLAMRMAERMTPKRTDSDPLEQFDRWAGLFEKFRSGKGWPDLVSDGIESMRPLIEMAVSRLGGPGGPTPTVNGSPPPKIEGPNMMWQVQLADFLRRQSRYLIGKAKAKASANLYAEVLLDNLPEAVTFPQLLELLKQPGALQRVFDLMPPDDKAAAESERAWFEELLRELVGFLEAQIAGQAPPGDKPAATDDTPAV